MKKPAELCREIAAILVTSRRELGFDAYKRESMTTDSVHCAKCQTDLDEPSDVKPESRKPCPNCGSTARTFEKGLEANVSFHDSVKMKLRAAATGKVTMEQLSGDELHKKSGKWMTKHRVIDRKKDEYKEVVIDPETGKLVHECNEPLSKHTGHGSAKKGP